MPSGEVEFDDGDETFDGVVDGGHWEEGLGVLHKTIIHLATLYRCSIEGREGQTL